MAPPSSPTSEVHADALGLIRDESFVSLLRARPDACDRSCFPDHLTASALVMSADASRVLLMLHRKAQRWFQMGGHIEPGDASLAAAALREATEESGIDGLRVVPEPVHLDVHEVGFCDPRGPVRHFDVRFVALAPAGAEPAINDESDALRWWPVDALPGEDSSVSDLVDAAVARHR